MSQQIPVDPDFFKPRMKTSTKVLYGIFTLILLILIALIVYAVKSNS